MKSAFLIEDNVAHELTFRHLFTRLWPYLRIYPGRLCLIAFLVVFYTAAGRALPLLFGYAVDQGVKTGLTDVIIQIAVLFGLCELARAGFAFLQSYNIQSLGNQVLFDIRERLIRHVQNLSASFFDRTSSGRVMTRVTNDVHSLGELFSQGFTVIFINIFEMFTIFVALMAISARLTFVLICMVPPLLWACNRISRMIRVRFGAAKRRLAMINAFTAESIGGIKVLQLFNQGQVSRQHFDRLSGEYKDFQLQTVKLFATLWPVVEGFNVGTVAATLLLGGYFGIALGLSAGQLAAFVLLVQGFFKPLRGILEKYNQLQNSLASADRVFQMFDVPVESQAGVPLKNSKLNGEIEFRHVTFSYPGQNKPAIRDVSFKIQAGQSVALVGRTGSGKTTIISLVQRLYDTLAGQILIDGQDINTLKPQELRQRLGVIQQDNFMFRGTIADNISLANPKISRETIEKSAQLAHCEQLVAHHNLGLNAQVEERGANLSVGERQLIAFARVLAFNPDILILDEATANIDSVHESLIQEATSIAMQGRTSLIIAHRLSTVLHCDRIILMSDGKILEEGSHLALMQKRGAYYDLYQAQTQSGSTLRLPSEVKSCDVLSKNMG